MNDQRKKEIRKGSVVVALIQTGSQVVARIADMADCAVLLSCDLALPIQPEQPITALLVEDEGPLVPWPPRTGKKKRDFFLDQRERKCGLGDEVASILPSTIQIICKVVELEAPVVVRRKGGAFWKPGSLTLAGEFTLPVIDGRVSCVWLPPEEEDDKKRSNESGIVVVQ